MTDDEPPQITVEAPGVEITVTDAMSAEAAMPFIEGALEYYLAGNSSLGESAGRRRQYEPVDAECEHCGYEWEYRGKDPNGTTCPKCNTHTTFDPRLDERGVR
jgi:Zn finger protein HypA/HybF involved in hydrogenase expression